jgi:hypothetical protein
MLMFYIVILFCGCYQMGLHVSLCCYFYSIETVMKELINVVMCYQFLCFKSLQSLWCNQTVPGLTVT